MRKYKNLAYSIGLVILILTACACGGDGKNGDPLPDGESSSSQPVRQATAVSIGIRSNMEAYSLFRIGRLLNGVITCVLTAVAILRSSAPQFKPVPGLIDGVAVPADSQWQSARN